MRKAAVLECALLDAARGRFTLHGAVRYAVTQLGRQRAVASVVDEVGLSQRRFIELFRNEVGVTPKAFSRVRRFQRVLGAVEDVQDVDWAEVALSAGYFDQAHFIHDFRDFAGVSPSTYLTHRRSRNHVAMSG
jgi:transcriptional regulator GlxA family with amidase domain